MSKLLVTAEHILANKEVRAELASHANGERVVSLTVITDIIDKHVYFEVKHSLDGIQNFENVHDSVEMYNLLIS